MGFRSFLNKMDRASEALFTLSGITCLVLPAIILLVVIIRAMNPAGMPLWSIDICELLMWFVTYLGLGLVWRLGRHVSVEVVVKSLPARVRRINEIIQLGLLLLMSGVMMWGGIRVCLDSWMTQKKTTNEFPEYFLSLAIPVGLTLLVYEISRTLGKRLSGKGTEWDRPPAGH